MGIEKVLSRREFLKLAGINLAALAFVPKTSVLTALPAPSDVLPQTLLVKKTPAWPSLQISDFPFAIGDILANLPRLEVNAQGILVLQDDTGAPLGDLPLARTQWNLERSNPLDRLMTEWSWGIVLHWYGETDYFDKTLTGYLRGFDGLRQVGDYTTRTSAHFLVGDAVPETQAEALPGQIGVVQTQIPDQDGVPYVASHLKPLDYTLGRERKQYYVKALDSLEYADPTIHSLLQDFYDGPKIDPGWRTIAIEITGLNFDAFETAPGRQKIANVLAVVWAVMKRYQISALDIMGHHEIELGKSDPGRGFMSLIRLLIGLRAMVEDDEQMKELVFGRLRSSAGDFSKAVQRYFQFLRDYLVLVSNPVEVYRWESRSKYWFVHDLLNGKDPPAPQMTGEFFWPLPGITSLLGDDFLNPEYHEGMDLFANRIGDAPPETPVRLVADGECLFLGKSMSHCAGKMVIFRHRQPDGAQVLTVYGHLSKHASLQVGRSYPAGTRLGSLASPQPFMERFLHFAVAYGATWETDLRQRPNMPLNARQAWIKDRYLPPMAFLSQRFDPWQSSAQPVDN